ncbi:hypothetical protein [Sulfolobus islandicus rod-shaped virus 4]|uniref:Uncharacterized protein n=1 Tax=Sulfolobus islandicus rod-shaped virus 4 TaxID=1983547 RepID=A0A1X9SJW7_9VIRU|nr:hypothetical protein CCL46_gp03 [Sulfolobus islandicus rod-shaped virus 4]ARQ96519.1 hypothetical protein [Sulfolobus islandicus rod-shaped virus 4]
MNKTQATKVRIGKKEKEVLKFLEKYPQGVWKDEVIRKFSWASRYDNVMNKRLYNLTKKGLIVIKNEINPETGRSKQRVYLKQ